MNGYRDRSFTNYELGFQFRSNIRGINKGLFIRGQQFGCGSSSTYRLYNQNPYYSYGPRLNIDFQTTKEGQNGINFRPSLRVGQVPHLLVPSISYFTPPSTGPSCSKDISESFFKIRSPDSSFRYISENFVIQLNMTFFRYKPCSKCMHE